MPLAALRAYVEALPRHKAENMLMLLQAASFPHMEERARASIMQQLTSTANGEARSPASPAQFRLNEETQTFEEV